MGICQMHFLIQVDDIDLVLPLKDVNLPKQYRIITHSVSYHDSCYGIDTSDIEYEFPIIKDRAIPLKKIEIRPNETKTFELKIESTPLTRPQINLSSSNETGRSLNFPQDNIRLDPYGVGYTFVNIHASSNITPQIYTIPVVLNFTNPTFTTIPLLFMDAKIFLERVSNTQGIDYLTINVLPKLTPEEYMTYGGVDTKD